MRRVSTHCRTRKGANGIAVVTFARVEYSAAADADWVALVAVVQPISGLARANPYLFAIRRKSKKTRAKTQMRWH
jgi:hypothetical protein